MTILVKRRMNSPSHLNSIPSSSGRAASNNTTTTTTTIHSLPSELLERVLEHAVGTRTSAGGLRERQWISASDLIQAQPLGLVCTTWRDSLRAIVRRFTFFSLPSPKSYTSSHLLRPLAMLPNLSALQLFLRPQEASVFSVALEKFLVLRTSKVHTVHICMPPVSARSASSSSAVNLITTAIARGISDNLTVLSLDSCGVLSPHLFHDILSRNNTPNLSTLALDSTYITDWNQLAILSENLVELSLRNCNLSDDDLSKISAVLPKLETLALGYSGMNLSSAGISYLKNCSTLRSVELARCTGIRDGGVLELANISSLTTIALLHIDVSANTLVQLVKLMGKRLSALCVTAVRTLGGEHAATIETVTKTAKNYCPNLNALEFSQRRSPHWSERAYAEQYRFVGTNNNNNNNNNFLNGNGNPNHDNNANNNYNNNNNNNYHGSPLFTTNDANNNQINQTLLFKHCRRRKNIRLHRFFKALFPNKRRTNRTQQPSMSR